MAVLNYEVPKTFDTNHTPTDRSTANLAGKSYAYDLSVFLAANGWTQTASNNWSAPSTMVGDTPGNAHSWVVLESPEGFVAGLDGSYTGDQSRIFFCMDLRATATSTIDFIFSGGVAFTGGTTTARPSASNENSTGLIQVIKTTGTDYLSFVFHFITDDDGSFWVYSNYSGQGAFHSLLVCNKGYDPVQLESNGFDYPFCVNIRALGSATTEVSVQGNTMNWGWGYDGTAGKNTIWLIKDQSSNILGVSTGTSGSSMNATNESSALLVCSDMTSHKAVICRIADMHTTPAVITNGFVNAGTIKWLFAGRMWIPFNAAVLGSVGTLDHVVIPVVKVVPTTTKQYDHIGWDSNGNFVYWSSLDAPDFSPTVTDPTLVGTLSGQAVIAVHTL